MTNVFTVSIQESRIIKLDYPLLVHVLSVCMHHVQRGNGGWGQGWPGTQISHRLLTFPRDCPAGDCLSSERAKQNHAGEGEKCAFTSLTL